MIDETVSVGHRILQEPSRQGSWSFATEGGLYVAETMTYSDDKIWVYVESDEECVFYVMVKDLTSGVAYEVDNFLNYDKHYEPEHYAYLRDDLSWWSNARSMTLAERQAMRKLMDTAIAKNPHKLPAYHAIAWREAIKLVHFRQTGGESSKRPYYQSTLYTSE